MALKKVEWEDNIDWGRLFRYLLSKWIYFILSMGLAYVIATIYLHYQSPVFTVTSSILIKTTGNSIEKNLGVLDLSNEDRSLNNQMNILGSFKTVKKTLQELDFGVSFFHAGNIRTMEMYQNNPYRIEFDSTQPQLIGVPLFISVLPNNKFRLQSLKPIGGSLYDLKNTQIVGSKTVSEINTVGTFGEPLITPFLSATFYLNSPDFPVTDEDPKFYFVINNLDNLAQAYKNKLRITPPEKKESSILQLSLTGNVAQKEITFLNKLAEVYIQNSLDEKNRNIINTMRFIDEQLAALSEDLDLSEDEKEKFQKKTKSLNFNDNAKEVQSKLIEQEKAKENLQLQLNYYIYLKDYLENRKNPEDLVVPSAVGVTDQLLSNLLGKLVSLQEERNTISPSASTKNPYLVQLDNNILLIKKSILENLKYSTFQTQQNIKKVADLITSLESSIEGLPSSERILMEIERKYNVKEHLYNFLLVKRAEAGITQAANRPDHMIIEEAKMLSAVQIGPKTALIKNEALLIGFFIPLVFFSLRNILSDKIMSKEMIGRFSIVPILGIVGHTIHKKSQFIVTDFPKSSVSEALRSIRINLTFLAPHVKNKVICITSSVSGEGKSFLSANLSTLIGMAGSRVIMVGADMRKPAKYQELGLTNTVGLSTYLSGNAPLDACIQKTHQPNMDFLLSGIVPPNPSELLSLPKMGDLIKELSSRYEYVIVDTPPVGLVSDAMLLFEYCDIHLMVVRYNYSSISMLKKLDEVVTSNPLLKNAMYIFNDYVEISKKYYYNRGYGYYDEGFENEPNPIKRVGKSLAQTIRKVRKIILDSLRV